MPEEERTYQVFTDPATGLYDRRTMWARLAEEVSRARRYRYPISLILVSVDPQRDALPTAHMLRLAEALKKSTRSSDILARYSEDTLAVLLPCTDESGALRLAQRIRRLAAEKPSPSGESAQMAALRIGVTSTSCDYDGDKVALVEQVEWALQKARTQGAHDRTVIVRVPGGPTAREEAGP